MMNDELKIMMVVGAVLSLPKYLEVGVDSCEFRSYKLWIMNDKLKVTMAEVLEAGVVNGISAPLDVLEERNILNGCQA
jgi:hypothetical protein